MYVQNTDPMNDISNVYSVRSYRLRRGIEKKRSRPYKKKSLSPEITNMNFYSVRRNKQKSVFQKPPKPNPHAKKSVSLEMTNKHLVFVDCTVSKALVHISDTELHLTEGDKPKCFTLRNDCLLYTSRCV